MIYQWFTVKDCCYVYFHVLSSASLWSVRQSLFCLTFLPRLLSLTPLIGWLHFEMARYQAYHWSHSGIHTAVQLVNTAESVASVIAKFSLTHATYNFVLTIVFRHFASLIETFRPTIPQLLSIFNSVSPSWLTAGTGGFVSGKTPEVNKVA